MPEKFKGKKKEKAGAAVEEEVLLLCIDVCDSYMQCVDIQDAYRFATIDGDYRFGNVTDEDDIPHFHCPTPSSPRCPLMLLLPAATHPCHSRWWLVVASLFATQLHCPAPAFADAHCRESSMLLSPATFAAKRWMLPSGTLIASHHLPLTLLTLVAVSSAEQRQQQLHHQHHCPSSCVWECLVSVK